MKKLISLIICMILFCGLIPLAASAEEKSHNHKYYFDYISRSDDQTRVESFGLFCEDCDEVVHVKTGGVLVNYSISYNGWGEDGKTEWYFIDGLVSLKDPLRISGNVNIVLLDNSLFICEEGIRVFDNGTLNIYSEHLDYSPEGKENTMGKLRSYTKSTANDAAAIGGLWDAKNVTVNLYGGDIYAYSAGDGAAIGGGKHGNATVNFHGGKVRAVTANAGAAIGGGYEETYAEINFYSGIVQAANEGEYRSAPVGNGFWECHSDVHFYGGYVYAKPFKGIITTYPGIMADNIDVVNSAKKIGNINGIYDKEGLALAKQAGWTDDSGLPIGSVLSDGNLWIILAVVLLAVICVTVLVIVKKKRVLASVPE